MIEVGSRVAAATLEIFRSCGGQQRECVAYWVVGTDGSRVVRVVHPDHTASWSGYRVDGAWVNQFFLDLGGRREHVVAQVHTHPHEWVGLSETDDRFVLLPSEGFVSIVVPDFGRGGERECWGVWVMNAEGEWRDGTGDVAWTTD